MVVRNSTVIGVVRNSTRLSSYSNWRTTWIQLLQALIPYDPFSSRLSLSRSLHKHTHTRVCVYIHNSLSRMADDDPADLMMIQTVKGTHESKKGLDGA